MQDFVFIKSNREYYKVRYSEIQYVEAVNKYIKVVTAKKSSLLLLTMQEAEKFLPAALFCRIHRSYIISLLHLNRFTQETAFVAETELPIGKHFKNGLQLKVTIWCAKENQVLIQNFFDKSKE